MAFNFYFFFLSLGFTLGFGFFFFSMWRKKMPALFALFCLALFSLPITLIGARLWTYLFSPPFQTTVDSLPSWDLRWKRFFGLSGEGFAGLSVHGGLIFAGCYFFGLFFWYSKKYKLSIFYPLDLLVGAVLIIQIVGRWGNFFNQELLGDVLTQNYPQEYGWIPDWFANKLHFSELGEGSETVRHPLFFYESVGNFLAFLLIFCFIPQFIFLLNYHSILNSSQFYKNNHHLWKKWQKLAFYQKPYYFLYQLYLMKLFWKKQIYNLKPPISPLPLIEVKQSNSFFFAFFPFKVTKNYQLTNQKIRLLKINFFKKYFYLLLLWIQRDCQKLTNFFNPLKFSFLKLGNSFAFYLLFYGILRLILQPYRELPDDPNQVMAVTNVVSILFLILGCLFLILSQFLAPRRWRQEGCLYESWYLRYNQAI